MSCLHFIYCVMTGRVVTCMDRGNTFNVNMCTKSVSVHKAYQDTLATEENMLLACHTTQLPLMFTCNTTADRDNSQPCSHGRRTSKDQPLFHL